MRSLNSRRLNAGGRPLMRISSEQSMISNGFIVVPPGSVARRVLSDSPSPRDASGELLHGPDAFQFLEDLRPPVEDGVLLDLPAHPPHPFPPFLLRHAEGLEH